MALLAMFQSQKGGGYSVGMASEVSSRASGTLFMGQKAINERFYMVITVW